MVGQFFGFVVGLLLGLAICYWRQLMTAYQHRDVISSGSDLIISAQNFWNDVKKL